MKQIRNKYKNKYCGIFAAGYLSATGCWCALRPVDRAVARAVAPRRRRLSSLLPHHLALL